MAHIHELIDFVVSVFIVNLRTERVLLVHHKKLSGWYAVGGHVELHETPDEAMDREINEETGLIVGENVWFDEDREYLRRRSAWNHIDKEDNPQNSRILRRPWSVEVHDFPPVPGHRHVALVYHATTDTTKVELEVDAHYGIRWFSIEMLNDPIYAVPESIRLYGVAAIEKARTVKNKLETYA